MESYKVSLDNEEVNRDANALSLTGRVNGVNVAKVVRLSAAESYPTDKARRLFKQQVLINAYLDRMVPSEDAPGETVSL